MLSVGGEKKNPVEEQDFQRQSHAGGLDHAQSCQLHVLTAIFLVRLIQRTRPVKKKQSYALSLLKTSGGSLHLLGSPAVYARCALLQFVYQCKFILSLYTCHCSVLSWRAASATQAVCAYVLVTAAVCVWDGAWGSFLGSPSLFLVFVTWSYNDTNGTLQSWGSTFRQSSWRQQSSWCGWASERRRFVFVVNYTGNASASAGTEVSATYTRKCWRPNRTVFNLKLLNNSCDTFTPSRTFIITNLSTWNGPDYHQPDEVVAQMMLLIWSVLRLDILPFHFGLSSSLFQVTHTSLWSCGGQISERLIQ